MPHYTRISAELELITPAFIGGAIDHAPHGPDPKSTKSALRYWWRALNSSHLTHQASPDHAPLLAELHREEMRLFGEAGRESGGQGQGMVQVVLRKSLAKTPGETAPLPSTPPGITYLLGQGLYDHKAGVTRKALAPCCFNLEIILFHPGSPASTGKDIEAVLNALLAFGMLGGLGSRQNRGFGSVALRSLALLSPATTQVALPVIPANCDQYLSLVRKLFANQTSTLPLLPAFSQHARYRVLVPEKGEIDVPALKKDGQIAGRRRVKTPNEWQLLAAVGEQFMLERSWGHYDRDRKRHYTNGRMEAEQNYQKDHHLIKAALGDRNYSEESRNSIPLRSIYGLPYFFGKAFGQTQGMNLLLKSKDKGSEATRRGSPFHIHITRIGDQPLAVLYSLPSLFIPACAQLDMGKLRPRDAGKVQFNYTVIERFMGRFTSNATGSNAASNTANNSASNIPTNKTTDQAI
jgi:CRISPR-associated protein Cmr1